MKRRMLHIENLVNTEAEQEYLLGADEDDNWSVIEETEPMEPPPSEPQPVPEPMSNVPASSQPCPVTQFQPVLEPPHEDEIQQAPTKKKKKGRTTNTWNYSLHDINVLLNIVEEHEPTGMNGWALVHREYNRRAAENRRASRAPDALKKKYDKLQYYQKRTGDPICPDYVRRAKNIQKEILSKMVSLTYNSNLSDHIGLAATDILPAAGNSRQKTSGPPEQEPAGTIPGNDETQTAVRRQTNRPPYISPSTRREIELNDSLKELANSVKEMAQLQNRREKRLLDAEDRDIDSLVKEVVERSRYSFQGIMVSMIEETMKRVLDNWKNLVQYYVGRVAFSLKATLRGISTRMSERDQRDQVRRHEWRIMHALVVGRYMLGDGGA
ncbi:hypothetical protein FGB62_255g01 [Gracilaria domingensis]|nr:hypothetical protein FGB62_255g01 [Gracilaria domingensis]